MPYNLSLCWQSARTEIWLAAVELYNMLLHVGDWQFLYDLCFEEVIESMEDGQEQEDHKKQTETK